jgi:hypothetical protein
MNVEQFTIDELRHTLIAEGDATAEALRKLTQQRDELLAALKEANDVIGGNYYTDLIAKTEGRAE